jgi:hypothetical protein
MSPVGRRLAVSVLALVAVPVLAQLPLPTAGAATTLIKIQASSFSPATVTITLGSSVQYRNDTGVAVLLRSTSSNWSFTEPLGIGATSNAHKPAVTGTFTAAASGVGVTSSGAVKVVKATATSTPTRQPTTRPTSPAPKPPPGTATPPPGATTPPTAQPSTGTGGPPILPGITPPANPTASANPAPSVAPAPTDPPALAGGSKRALIQAVPGRRLGLPGALSAVLALGLLFGIGRVLLSLAPPADRSPS